MQVLWYGPLAEAQLVIHRVHHSGQGTKYKGTLNLANMVTQNCCMCEWPCQIETVSNLQWLTNWLEKRKHFNILNCKFCMLKFGYSRQKDPASEVNRHSASQEIRILQWTTQLCYPIHKNLPLIPIQSQKNRDHILTFYFLKICISINPIYVLVSQVCPPYSLSNERAVS